MCTLSSQHSKDVYIEIGEFQGLRNISDDKNNVPVQINVVMLNSITILLLNADTIDQGHAII